MRNKIILTAGFLLLALGLLGAKRFAGFAASDPDRYYHIALSRMMAESGQPILRALPQAEDLGWEERFVDKEFLFHQLTALAYLLGGEKAVELVPFLCAALCLLAFLWFAGARLPPALAVSAAFLAFSSPYLLARLQLLRPHSLAIFFFLLMNIALLARRPLLTGFAACLFTLSYHAFYVPLACLLLAGLLAFFLDKKGSSKAEAGKRASLAGAFGVVVGVLVNPYFYGNVELAILIARIPGLIAGGAKELSFGAELYPMRTDVFLSIFHLPIALILAGLFAAGQSWKAKARNENAELRPLVYLLGVSGFFLCLSFRSPRAGEYLAPATGMLAVYLLRFLPAKLPFPAALIPLMLGLSQVFVFQHKVKEESAMLSARDGEEPLAAVAAIPADARGAKVYNCEWSRSPYLLYLRPDLRFVDLLDPSLLHFLNPPASRARVALQRGHIAHAQGLIRGAAKAEFVLCADPGVVSQLQADPAFQQIHPGKGGSAGPYVFRVKSEEPAEYVLAFRVKEIGAYSTEARPQPSAASSPSHAGLVEGKTYLDLAAQLAAERPGEKGAPGQLFCALVAPSEAELRRRAGASTLMVGGGQGLEIWRNGKPLFRSYPGFPTNRMAQVSVPLQPALSAQDRLEILVCSSTSAPFWGLALSLWKEHELQATCAWKNELQPTQNPSTKTWAFQGTQRANCLAPYATKSDP